MSPKKTYPFNVFSTCLLGVLIANPLAFLDLSFSPMPPSDGITLVSVASDGVQANDDSDNPAISANGRVVVFGSSAANLVVGDKNNKYDIFAHDCMTGKTVLVSVASDGTQGNDASFTPFISADGRIVVFASDAANLVAGDTNKATDIFVRDLKTGKTERVSLASDGKQANGLSRGPSISADGRFVAFASAAGNLAPGDKNGKPDIFVHDRQTGKTALVSLSGSGAQGDVNSYYPRISADGQVVAFLSDATTLVSGDTNKTTDVFVRDLKTGKTERLSVAADGKQANGPSTDFPALSADGRFVAFTSEADNLVTGDTNAKPDIFLRDRKTGKTLRVSVASDGKQSTGVSRQPALSADGQVVAFASDAADLATGDTNRDFDIYLHNLQTGKTLRVSVAAGGKSGNKKSIAPAISADGRMIAFTSEAANLVTKDQNNKTDVFVSNGAQ